MKRKHDIWRQCSIVGIWLSGLGVLSWPACQGSTLADGILADDFTAIRLEITASNLTFLSQNINEPVRGLAALGGGQDPQTDVQVRIVKPAYLGKAKPDLLLEFGMSDPGNKGKAVCAFYLKSSSEDRSYLGKFCATRLALDLGVPAPRIGHGKLFLNGKDLGVYLIKEAIAKQWLEDRFGKHTAIVLRGKDEDVSGDLQPVYSEIASRPVLLEGLVLACLETNLAKRLELLTQFIDWEEFCRFMAWESFVLNFSGYCEGIEDYLIYLNLDAGRIAFIPGEIKPGFLGAKLSALNAKRGLVARSVMELPMGRVAFLRSLSMMVTNAGVESQLLRAMEERGKVIESMLTGPLEKEHFRFFKGILAQNLSQRFSEIRKQLKAYPIVDEERMARLTLPAISMTKPGQSKALPVQSGVDYGKELAALYAGTNHLTASTPINVYDFSITGQSNQIESLGWRSTNWLSVDVRCEGREFKRVGLRLKGHGTRRDFMAKSSFTLKFNRNVKGQRFAGQSKIHFHSALFNPSYLNEFLGAWLFQRVGQPCPRIGFARVAVNERDFGLYVVVEAADKSFLTREFDGKDGLLFEGESGDIDAPMDLDSGNPPEPYSRIEEAYMAAKTGIQIQSLDPLKEYCDVDRLAAFVAMEVILGHHDGYSMKARNYRIYQSAPASPFVLLPHGMDNLRLDMAGGVFPAMQGILARSLIGNPEGRTLYLRVLRDILGTHLDVDRFAMDAACVCRLIQPALQASDPLRAPDQLRAAQHLAGALADRKAYLASQIEAELAKLNTTKGSSTEPKQEAP